MLNVFKQKNIIIYIFSFCAILLTNTAYPADIYPSQTSFHGVAQIDSSSLHDPTQPPGMGYLLERSLNPYNEYNLHIDGIFIGKNKKIAIINGQRVSIGDKIFNIDVIDIYNNSVRFKDEKSEFTIPMISGVIKTETKNTERKN